MFQIRDLCFNYSGKPFLENVSFDLRENDIVGFLGANGSGKTTLIECLEGVRIPHSGCLSYCGIPVDSEFAKHVGIQFQEASFFQKLKVGELMKIAAQLHELPGEDIRLMNDFGLTEHENKNYEHLSGGMKQKVAIAIAVMNGDSKIIFLDEPTTGLDVFTRRILWEKIRDLKKAGKTVILTTHYIEEAEELCDDILVMDQGRVIAHASPASLNRHYCREKVVEVEFSRLLDGQKFSQKYPFIKGIRCVNEPNCVYEIKYACEEDSITIEDVLSALLQERNPVIRFSTKKYDLETALFNIIGYSIDDSGEIVI
jgi:ABC-2 type transport system ATP-binding protein